MSRGTGKETVFPNGIKAFPRDAGNSVIKTAAYTVVAGDCLGSTIIVDSDAAVIITLVILTSAEHGIVTIVNNRPGQLLTVNPDDADGIGFGNQEVDGTSIVNTAATAKKGDFVTLRGDAATGTFWQVLAIGGIWAVGA